MPTNQNVTQKHALFQLRNLHLVFLSTSYQMQLALSFCLKIHIEFIPASVSLCRHKKLTNCATEEMKSPILLHLLPISLLSLSPPSWLCRLCCDGWMSVHRMCRENGITLAVLSEGKCEESRYTSHNTEEQMHPHTQTNSTDFPIITAQNTLQLSVTLQAEHTTEFRDAHTQTHIVKAYEPRRWGLLCYKTCIIKIGEQPSSSLDA